MNHAESLKFIRREAKKNGLTFSRQGKYFTLSHDPVYRLSSRRSPNKKNHIQIIRDCLTLDIAFEIACSGELELYK